MGYRNPLTSLPADDITSGNLTGLYQLVGQILAGAASGSHVVIKPTGLIFYGADGVTPLITMDTSSGAGTIDSATINAGTITGALIQTSTDPTAIQISGGGGADQIFIGVDPGFDPGAIFPNPVASGGVTTPVLQINGPTDTGADAPILTFTGIKSNGTGATNIDMEADSVTVGTYKVLTGLRGTFSGTTDANGRVAVTHGLGIVPVAVFAHPNTPDGGSPIVAEFLTPSTSWNSSQFSARAVSTTGAAVASTAVSLSWLVLA